ncbi:aminotransferase class IV [Thalassospira sp.]|uniref:aminotransferase class IV n=1 Tax=Thalassospira sp. TaxID=1912094 RepID=UPI0027324427|nr:aminotransferase class IV [Thalassospira sp.]MDP2697979.1 aminotransferase class IV [Thalassospira sp.]
MKIWLNGQMMDTANARIDPMDRGFLLGDGMFETMRAHRGIVAWLKDHLTRLSDHASQIGLDPAALPSASDVTQAIAGLCGDMTDAAVRLTVTRGIGPRGLLPPDPVVPTCLITATAFTPRSPDSFVSLAISQKIRRNPWSVAGRIKSLNYLDNIIARQESADTGADDALILSVDGSLAETGIANLFILKNGILRTPDPAGGALGGIARQFVLDWAMCNGMDARVETLWPDDLGTADLVFVCNALQGVRAVGAIDGRVLTISPVAAGFLENMAQAIEASQCLQSL